MMLKRHEWLICAIFVAMNSYYYCSSHCMKKTTLRNPKNEINNDNKTFSFYSILLSRKTLNSSRKMTTKRQQKTKWIRKFVEFMLVDWYCKTWLCPQTTAKCSSTNNVVCEKEKKKGEKTKQNETREKQIIKKPIRCTIIRIVIVTFRTYQSSSFLKK